MKLGFWTDSLDDIERADALGFSAVELDIGALGDPKAGDLDPARVEEAGELSRRHDVEITAIGYYGLAFDPPREDEVDLIYDRVFDAALKLGVTTITSLSGFDADRDWAANLDVFEQRFGAIAARAEAHGLRVALENWMGFWGRLPFRPLNMGGSPATWHEFFERVPSTALGLEFDPSHLAWQGIDPYRALHEFADRVYHFHAKDVETLPEQRYRYGVNGDTYRFRIPGYGELDWPRLVSILVEHGYEGGVTLEHEDDLFAGDRREEGLVRGLHVLGPLVQP